MIVWECKPNEHNYGKSQAHTNFLKELGGEASHPFHPLHQSLRIYMCSYDQRKPSVEYGILIKHMINAGINTKAWIDLPIYLQWNLYNADTIGAI